MKTLHISSVLLLFIFMTNCSLFKSKELKKAETKMNFSFSKIDKNGLIKKRGTSLSYEFCIPNKTEYIDEIHRIDESIGTYKSSKGRIGCGANEILCIGETADKDYKKILIALTNLNYVKQINESFFE